MPLLEYYSIATLNSPILRTAKEDQKNNNNNKKGKIESNQKTKERRKKKINRKSPADLN